MYIYTKIKDVEDKVPDITNLATNTTLNTKLNEAKKEVPSITNLATNSAFNANINEVKGKIAVITNLDTTTTLTAVEIKIPNVSNLVRKTDYNTKISEIEKKITDYSHDKYITTPEFNKLTAGYFAGRLTQANLTSKNGIADLIKKTYFDDKLKKSNENVTSNKTKYVLVENKLSELSKKIKAISTKELINKFSILN